MKLKLKEIIRGFSVQLIFQTLQVLSERQKPAILSMKLRQWGRALEPILQDYEKERTQLIKTLGEQIEGESYQIPPNSEKMPEFLKEMEQLLDADVELPEKINLTGMLAAIPLEKQPTFSESELFIIEFMLE
jgi:uncharacterized protein (UPF0128 family)